ncbi:hypothetical protein F4678DRAFT_373349 [Xylaria arbuscula]|nr:hypothetical protein F4678DRAFT_373349 [Xylaria arbuscula]
MMENQLPSSGPTGYGCIADAMGADDDLLMFRRFTSLNARNLLYMQAELAHLESKLSELDMTLEHLHKGLAGWEVLRSWDKMTGSEEGKEHLAVVNEIRQKLEQYSKTAKYSPIFKVSLPYSGPRSDTSSTLIHLTQLNTIPDNALQAQASIVALRRPRRRIWETLIEFVNDKDNHVALKDKDKHFLQDAVYEDLVALGGGALDPMTTFLLKFFARFFQTEQDRSRTRGILNFSSTSRVRGFVRILAIIASSLLPVLSIIVLYYIKSQSARLITIVAFSALCSLALTVLTDARNAEIIATTAAYAAVQVVFVSGDFSS